MGQAPQPPDATYLLIKNLNQKIFSLTTYFNNNITSTSQYFTSSYTWHFENFKIFSNVLRILNIRNMLSKKKSRKVFLKVISRFLSLVLLDPAKNVGLYQYSCSSTTHCLVVSMFNVFLYDQCLHKFFLN